MMAKKSSVVITAMGALTPLGDAVTPGCAAIEAGISRVTEHAYYQCIPDDPEWDEDLICLAATVPTIDPFTDGIERFLELTIPSLTEVFESANIKRADLQQTVLYIALPQIDESTSTLGLVSNFVPELCKRTGLTSFKGVKINQLGHTGVFAHISDAIETLESATANFCIVGGVDSYLLASRLEFMDKSWRIRSDRTVDGFIPGEASVMLMLETEAHAKARGAEILAKITAVSEAQEENIISSDKMSSGMGLTDAIKGVIGQTGSKEGFQAVYCSLNGESYYHFEWGLQLTRLSHVFENLSDILHPAEYVGDVGSATGALLVACATKSLLQGKLSGNKALLWASSDSNQRMALCLEQA